jgi:general stress protein 26
MNIPEDIAHNLLDWFGFPQESLYCQVATTSKMLPHLRTMRVYELTDEGSLVFLTSTTSIKWFDLQINPVLAICMLHGNTGQITAEGPVELVQYKNNPEMTRKFWQQMDGYWQKYYYKHSAHTFGSDLPDSFGIIIFSPTKWGLLEICRENYDNSRRKEFNWIKNTWMSKLVELE